MARAMVAIQVPTVLKRLRTPVRNAMWMKPQPSHPITPLNLTGPARGLFLMADLLRLLTCGSVDDGKSTLIGRMLHDCGAVAKDKLEGLDRFLAARRRARGRARAGHHHRCRLSLFRHRASPLHPRRLRRATSNIPATWRPAPPMPSSPSCWSTRRKGVLTQTRRHAMIARLLGIEALRVRGEQDGPGRLRRGAVQGDPRRFRRLRRRARHRRVRRSSRSARSTATMSPRPSPRMPWYDGPALLPWLEEVGPSRPAALEAFRMPVQQVIREDGARFYAGMIASGAVQPGDRIVDRAGGHAAPRSPGSRRWTAIWPRPKRANRSPSTFTAEVDCSRGDLIAAADPAAAGRRPVRGGPDLDGRGAAAARPPISAEARHPDGAGDRAGAQIQARHRHDGAARGARRWRSTRSAPPSSTPPSRSPSSPMRRAGRSAASS